VNTGNINRNLVTLFSELLNGPPRSASSYMLNRGDEGLLASLARLSATAASASARGGASIAAHVEHLRYGLSLMNRWAAGEDPFSTADWSASWRRSVVSESEWTRLRSDLAHEGERWLASLNEPRDVDETELNGLIGSIAHLGYHLGAIRQIDRVTRGPAAND
jgi:hypothetical protein